ncbi:hypothetical protein ABIA31_004357 [Catenulispora sp. MAP5-51]|uniref:hypothetical protein n=1 Tax=Catenulispora sp. MAP5-51 TaxID=3156298 RepID=UPI0035118254
MSLAYGEQQRNSSALSASGAGGHRELERQYHVVLQDSLGHPALGFREGTWFRLTVSGPQPMQLRGAIRTCPHAAGSIVQIACWWMRENPMQPRSLDLATELALTVGELVRVCPADGLGTTSMDLLPMAMAAVAQSGPPVSAAPALPSGSGAYSTSGSAFGSTPALGSSASTSSDPFGSGPAFGSTSTDPLYGTGTSSSSATSGYGSTSAYGSTSSSGAYSSQTSGYGSSSAYGSGSPSTDAYGSSTASSGGYSSSAGATDAYSSGSGAYGSTTSSSGGYSSTSSSGGYSSTSSSGGYGSTSTSSSSGGWGSGSYASLADPLNDPLPSSYSSTPDPLSQSTYSASPDPLGQSGYSSGTYATTGSYDAAPTSYLPAATGAQAANNGWFEPADGTGTGGFPAVPPAPVMGRPVKPAPAPSAPPPPPAPGKPYSNAPGAGAGRGYQGGATQQAALPPANRPRDTGADWEPRAAAPRRPGAGNPSHQPRPQQQPAAPRPVPGATGQQPRPRPQQPRDGYGRPAEPQQDLSRSSDRNGVPPRRPAAAATPQQRGTMGRRPATRPGRPSER